VALHLVSEEMLLSTTICSVSTSLATSPCSRFNYTVSAEIYGKSTNLADTNIVPNYELFTALEFQKIQNCYILG
jgi:hypothetical protein